MSLKLYLYKKEPNSDMITIRRNVSLFFLISGLLYLVKNIIEMIRTGLSFQQLLNEPLIIGNVIFVVISIFCILVKHRNIGYLQIVLLLGLSTFFIIGQYNSPYGFALWTAAFLLTRKYQFPGFRNRIINLLFVVFIIILTEYSSIKSAENTDGLWHILFTGLSVLLIYTIYRSELNRVEFSEKDMQNSIHELIQERSRLKEHIDEKQIRLSDLESQILSIKKEKKPFDLKECRLTPAELRIVEVLVKTRASNREISEHLGIKENTVKQHLYKVFNKMGVDDRFQIIDLCKYNFD